MDAEGFKEARDRGYVECGTVGLCVSVFGFCVRNNKYNFLFYIYVCVLIVF